MLDLAVRPELGKGAEIGDGALGDAVTFLRESSPIRPCSGTDQIPRCSPRVISLVFELTRAGGGAN